jgi:hypothetical protein
MVVRPGAVVVSGVVISEVVVRPGAVVAGVVARLGAVVVRQGAVMV